jgi:hypothetical protein
LGKSVMSDPMLGRVLKESVSCDIIFDKVCEAQ